MIATVEPERGSATTRTWPADAVRANPPLGILLGATLVFWVAVGWALIRRHNLFGDFTFDAGIFDQGLWLLSRFKDPFVTLRGLNLFGDHASFVLPFLAPLYWIWPNFRIILVLTAGCVAAGGPLTYALGRRLGLTSKVSVTLAVLYLVNPIVLWQAHDGFHPEIVAMPAIIGAFLAFLSKRPWWVLAPVILMLAAKEDAAFVVVPIALYFAFRPATRKPAAAAIGLATGVFLLDFFVVLPHFSPTEHLVYTDRYAAFGSSFGGIVANVVTHPGTLVDAIANQRSLVYVAALVLPLVLSLAAPDILAIAVPITLVNLTSSFAYQQEPGRHYTIYAISLVAVAAVVGTKRVLERVRMPRARTLSMAAMVAATLVAHPLVGPYGHNGAGWGGWVTSAEAHDVVAALSLIPDEASLAADPLTAAYLSHRTVVYELPNPWVRRDWGSGGAPPTPDPTTVEWVAALNPAMKDLPTAGEVLTEVESNGAYDVAYRDSMIVILHRRTGN